MVSVAMSNPAQSDELLQPPDQHIPPPSRAPQRSYSWTQEGPLPLSQHNSEIRRKSAFATAVPKPIGSTFWKNSGQVWIIKLFILFTLIPLSLHILNSLISSRYF